MQNKDFAIVIEDTFKACEHLLGAKNEEYSRDKDRLSNFRKAAKMQGTTAPKALKGMLVKHLVSVFDMIDDFDAGKFHTKDRWNEKVYDCINYFVLLKCLIEEGNVTKIDKIDFVYNAEMAIPEPIKQKETA